VSLLLTLYCSYDIAKHYEYERSRGVHQLSMMARAMGGPSFFSALSPSVILSAAALLASQPTAQPTAQAPTASQPTATDPTTPQLPKPSLAFYAGFDLLGDAIPARTGLTGGSESGAAAAQAAMLGEAERAAAAAHALVTATGISVTAARQLPPTFILTGCADHMVPWHEGAELVTQLLRWARV
jgi:hypothetical protein